MQLVKDLKKFTIFSEDPLEDALRKINENKQGIVFCVDSAGRLVGSLTDGDFRRWMLANSNSPLTTHAVDACNLNALKVSSDLNPSEIANFFSPEIRHIPIVDSHGHLVALAVDSNVEIQIGSRVISKSSNTFVIAEIGNNHNGSVELAKQLVKLAVESGADAVKFQLRDMDTLYRQKNAATSGEDLGAQYTLDLLKKVSLPAEELFKVFDYAKNFDVELMCTPWDLASVDALANYGVSALKIASADLTNHELISRAASKGLPLILSTGMSTEGEILETVKLLEKSNSSFLLLHCQSTYPAPYKDINLEYLSRLAELGNCLVGYSGHERGWHIPVAAVALGASVIEKHFTVDKTMEGNDHTVSLLPEEFSSMVRQIRELELALGSSSPREISTGEMMNRTTLAKSLVASRNLEIGQVLTLDDISIKSPGRGIQPNRISELVGLKLTREMQEGDFFFAGDLSESTPRGREYQFKRQWGLPVRYHDLHTLIGESKPDFVEFHFSYRDLEIDLESTFSEPFDMRFTTHLPDLFAGDFIVDLASMDDDIWARSIREIQRTIDVTRNLKKWFPGNYDPVMVATLGGFTKDGFLPVTERAARYSRVAAGLGKLDTEGIVLAAQTLPPFPWLMGGQNFANLFLDPKDTVEFLEETGTKLCLDISHTQLASNHLGISLSEAVELLAEHTVHLHLVDAVGVDGEGVQVGLGEVDWAALAKQLDRLTPESWFIPEIWQGHINNGEGFWVALDKLEKWF